MPLKAVVSGRRAFRHKWEGNSADRNGFLEPFDGSNHRASISQEGINPLGVDPFLDRRNYPTPAYRPSTAHWPKTADLGDSADSLHFFVVKAG
ncbi:MAG: hypothetical protein ACPHL6_03735 [Rubripirellula sp.]